MSSCVCILHSTGSSCSRELISQAVYGTSAVFHSIINSSPDFIPTVAVLRANPIEGVRYAYTSCANDAPHETEEEEKEKKEKEEEEENSDKRKVRRRETAISVAATETGSSIQNNDLYSQSVVDVFAGRSAIGLQRAIMRCASDDVDNSACVRDDIDRWGCLAGALLTACCFLRSRMMGDEVGNNTNTSNSNNNSNTNADNDITPNNNNNNPVVSSQLGCIIVFSDVCDTHALSFATECAFSTAAVALTKLNTAVHVFGPATQFSAIATRLQALANATGGVCAPAFAFAHVGRLLTRDIHTATARQLRERLISQYVVRPFNLPLDAGSVGERETESESKSGSKNGNGNGNASSLAWLCPACMAVVVRHAVESETTRKCPYCAVDNGSDGGEY